MLHFYQIFHHNHGGTRDTILVAHHASGTYTIEHWQQNGVGRGAYGSGPFIGQETWEVLFHPASGARGHNVARGENDGWVDRSDSNPNASYNAGVYRAPGIQDAIAAAVKHAGERIGNLEGAARRRSAFDALTY